MLEKFKFYFDKAVRGIELITGLVTVVTGLGAAYVYAQKIMPAHQHFLMAALCGLVSIWFALMRYTVWQNAMRTEETLRDIHLICHELRDLHHYLHQSKAPTIELADKVAGSIESICTRLALMLSRPGKECHACVKLFSHDDKTVTTLGRNENCAEGRHDPRRDHKVDENTDFQMIIQQKCKYFYESDLSKMGASYLNDRPDWKNFYLCTLVLPIQCVTDKRTKTAKVLGFLCVDSLSTNAFPEKPTVHLLATVADSMYTTLAQYRQKMVGAKNK